MRLVKQYSKTLAYTFIMGHVHTMCICNGKNIFDPPAFSRFSCNTVLHIHNGSLQPLQKSKWTKNSLALPLLLCFFDAHKNLGNFGTNFNVFGDQEKKQKNRDLVIFSLCIISKFVGAINPTFMCNKRRGTVAFCGLHSRPLSMKKAAQGAIEM